MSTKITYNGKTTELADGYIATLPCKDLKMETDVVVEAPEGSGGDLTINGVIEQYKVNAGATVTAGDFVEFVNKFNNGEFYTGTPSYIAACKLDNNRVLVAYRNNDTEQVEAVVITINGASVTVGASKYVGIYSNSMSISALTDSKAIYVASSGATTSSKVQAAIINVVGDVITVGSLQEIHAATYGYQSAVVALTETTALAVHYGGSSGSTFNYAVLLNISGNSITKATTTSFGKGHYNLVVALSATKVLLAYDNASTEKADVKARVITVNEGTIGVGSEVTLSSCSSSDAPFISIAALSEDKAIIAYKDSKNLGYGTACVLTINGSTITKGTTTVFRANTTNFIAVAALSETKALVSFYGSAQVLTIDGTTISAGEAKIFNPSATGGTSGTYKSIIPFSATDALVVFTDAAGKYTSLSIADTEITINETTNNGTTVQKATTRLHNVGVAKTSGAEGEIVDVYCVEA